MNRAPYQGHILGIAAFLTLPVAVLAPKGLAPLLILTTGALVGDLALRRQWPLPLPRMPAVALAALVLWAALSALWSTTPGRSLSTAASVGGMMLAGGLLVGTVRHLSVSERRLFVNGFVAGGVVGLAMFGIEFATDGIMLQWARHLIGREVSSSQDVLLNYNSGLSLLVLMLWPFLLALGRRWGIVVAGMGLVAVIAVLHAGEADAPFAALAVGVVAVAAWRVAARATVLLLAVATVALAVAAPWVPQTVPPIETVVEKAPYLSNSMFHRIEIWRTTAQTIAERPFIGHGMDTARSVRSGAVIGPLKFPDSEGNLRWSVAGAAIPLHPHNAFLQIWLELGGVGAMIGLAVVGTILQGLWRLERRRLEGSVAIGTLVSALFIASVSYGIWQNWWLGALWLTAAWTIAAIHPSRDQGSGLSSLS